MREGKSHVYKAYKNSSQQSSYNLMRPQAQTWLQFKLTHGKLEAPVPKEGSSLVPLLPWRASNGSIAITPTISPSRVSDPFRKVATYMECMHSIPFQK